MFSPTRQRALSLATFVALPLFAACTTDGPADPPTAATLNRAGYQQPGAHRQYGTPSKLGNGMARTYVVVDAKDGQRPLELGVAIDQDGLQGLPADMRMLHMPFPNHAPEPYTFMMLDWNPPGHEPPGAYDVPHFDFHFYWQAESEVMAIDPSDPDFASKANALPSGDFLPPFYILPIPPFLPPSAIAVPGMGVH